MDARILLVEDDEDLREAMAAALAADGHHVELAGDGRTALERLADDGHDVVLLDVALGPGPDGVEVCRRLRSAGFDVYVMMLTARGGEADVVLALEVGADDYLVKPIDPDELLARVRTHHQSETLVGIDFLQQQQQPSYWTLDASLTVATAAQRHSVSVFGQNLTDRTIMSNTFALPFSTFAVGVLRPPRTIGVRMDERF